MTYSYRIVILAMAGAAILSSAGCGSGKTQVSGREFTEEEIAKQKAEDSAVEAAESQGKRKDGKKQK